MGEVNSNQRRDSRKDGKKEERESGDRTKRSSHTGKTEKE